MAKIKSGRPCQGCAGIGNGGAKLVGSLAIFLNVALLAPAFAGDCPKSPEVFTANGRWATKDLGGTSGGMRILAIGSSSTQGVGASQPAHSYPADLEALLDARFPTRSIQVVNAGIGGETAHQTVARLDTALANDDYGLVIWQVGTNDAVEDVDPAGFRAVLEEGISAARQAAIPLILVDPQYYPGASHPNVYASFVEIVDEVGKERGVPLFSRYALMKAWAGESADVLATMLAKDLFHMSDRGYACWASLLADDISSRVPTIMASSKSQDIKSVVPVAASSTPRTLPPAP